MPGPYRGMGRVHSPHRYCRSEIADGVGFCCIGRTEVRRLALLLVALVPMVAAAAAAFQFRIEPSTADVVLRQLAQQADTQILFPLDQVRSIKANGLVGEYPVARALEIVLAGTGLRASLRDTGVIVVSLDPSHEQTQGGQKMKRGIWGILLGAFSGIGAAGAQDTAPLTETVETVVVTGSLIKRTIEESSQLVTTIDSEEMFRRGSTNAVDILSAVSQHQPIATSSDGARSGGLTNLANLRNLGPENTLVLVNGKRVVNNPIFDNGVDLNTIPTSLLETVDVLADGASSIYGSDAVAGVINFRTRTDFEGLQYTARMVEPEEPGGELRSASLGGGLGSLSEDHWNVVAGFTWRDREAINAGDRSFADYSVVPNPRGGFATIFQVQPFPANAIQDGVVRNPYPCTPPIYWPLATGGCGFLADKAHLIDLANAETQKSAYARATTKFAEQQLSLEYLWAESSVTSAITPTDIFNFQMPNANPYYPGLGITPAIPGFDTTRPITITTRFTPGGRRTTESASKTDRVLLQLEGEVLSINYDLWGLQSESTTRLRALDGALLTSGINDMLAGTNGAPFMNPFGPQSPEAEAYLDRIKYRGTLALGEGTLKMAGLTLSRRLFDLPGGPLSLALAYEHGDEEMSYSRDPINALLRGVVTGNGVDAKGDRSRDSLTAELLVPLTDRVEADLSVRRDEYSDFGNTTNPKVMITWRALPSFSLHGSYNEGFRAPPLPKLFAPQSLGLAAGFRNDPVLCPGGVPNTALGGIAARDCGVVFNQLSGGNEDLQPQESDAWAAGFDLNLDSLPLGYASIGVDYWAYEIRSAIGTLSTNAIFANPTQFSSYLVRCSQADPQFVAFSIACSFPGGTGDALAYVAAINANIGTTRTSGVDLDANWVIEAGIGTFSVNYRGTYLTEYEFQRLPGDPFLSRLGRYADGTPAIRYTHYLNLGFERGAWNFSAQNRWRGGYEDCNLECSIALEFANNEVDSYSLWNMTTTYKLSDAFSITLHAENIFDEEPPFTNAINSNCTGCDLRFVDVTGRAFGITVMGHLGRGE
jgi:iron complex outermembrane recepter protein